MTAEELIEQAKLFGLEPEDLDEEVHEAVATMAANINNGGLDDQIEFLVERLGEQAVEAALADCLPNGWRFPHA